MHWCGWTLAIRPCCLSSLPSTIAIIVMVGAFIHSFFEWVFLDAVKVHVFAVLGCIITGTCLIALCFLSFYSPEIALEAYCGPECNFEMLNVLAIRDLILGVATLLSLSIYPPFLGVLVPALILVAIADTAITFHFGKNFAAVFPHVFGACSLFALACLIRADTSFHQTPVKKKQLGKEA